MESTGTLVITVAATIVVVVIMIALVEFYEHLKKRWLNQERRGTVNKVLSALRLFDSIVGFALEIGMYVLFITGKLSFFNLLVGFCLLRIAGYCYTKTLKSREKKQGIPYAD